MEFDSPPPPVRGRGRKPPPARLAALDELRRNPGRWAKYPPSEGDPYQNPASVRSQALAGRAGFCPAGAWDVVARAGILYIKYIGEGNDHVAE